MRGKHRESPTMKAKMLATVVAAAVASVALPAAAGADDGTAPVQPPGAGGPEVESPKREAAHLSVRVPGIDRGRRPALRRATAVGRLEPFVPRQRVRVRFLRDGKVVKGSRVRVRRAAGADHGTFKLRSPRLTKPGRYEVRALKRRTATQAGARAGSERFRLRFPSLKRGDRGKPVRLLNKLLRRQGYVTGSGKRFGKETARAALAFRKVNGESRQPRISPQDFERLAKGKGGYKVKHPKAGKHVEVSIKKQVMALVKGRKVDEVYHVSTGKPGTPSVRGKFRFYMRQPGYNNVRMKDSVYFHRGYAIHGYDSVPDYPASHGCVRSAIPNATHIANWVEIGMQIFIY